MSQEREINMDYLRIACCFLIVLLHFSSSYWNCVPIGSFSFNVMTVYNCLTRIAVPIFIMLSGYFLLDRQYSFELKSYLRRPLRLLLTFYVWASFYAFQGLIIEFIKTGEATKDRIEHTIHEFFFGHYHMWFCFLIVGYYFLFPIAKRIAEDRKVLNLFMFLWWGCSFILPCLFGWANLPTFSRYFDGFDMNAVEGYWGYFFLGYFIKQIQWTDLKKWIVYIMGFISLVATILLSLYQSISKDEYVETWFSPGSPFILLMSVAVFLLFYSMKKDKCLNKMITTISESTFFIYMFHIFILEKLNLVGITTISFNPLLSVPVLSAVAFAVSLGSAQIARRIPVIGKILLYK